MVFVCIILISDVRAYHVVVVGGGGEVLEDGGDAEEDDVEKHIQQVTEGQAEHHSFLDSFSWGFFFVVFLFRFLLGLFWWNIFIWNLSMSWWKFFWISFLENQMIPDVFPTTPNTPTRS